MNVRDLIEKLQRQPQDATIFLSDGNIEILDIQYDHGAVQILIDDRCINCDELEREIDSKNEYIEELRENEISFKDEITKLEKQINQLKVDSSTTPQLP